MLRFGAFHLVIAVALLWRPSAPAFEPPRDERSVAGVGGVPVDVLARRRAALFDLLEPGIALLPSGDRRPESEYPQDSDFRQDNNFYYLTGLETAGSWLVLVKGTGGVGDVRLYLPERDPIQETWTGPQLVAGPEVARRTGIEDVRPASRFESDVISRLNRPPSLGGYPRLYLPLGGDDRRAREFAELAVRTRRSISDLGEALAQLRLVKDSTEVERLRTAVAITVEAQRRAMEAARPGIYEYELEAIVEYEFRSRGAERVGFPTIVGSGPNSTILHYDKNRRRTSEPDLVVIDAGAEYGYYTADVTRTFPVSGVFTPRQRAIYELVLATQRTAIDSVRPGVTMLDLERIARRYMREHANGLCGDAGCDRYFGHGLGHWLGMDVHDVGSYTTPLAPGMVLTIEPGIYLAAEGLGVRIEDDVLVTESGREVLSAAAPKTVDEIEALMRGAAPRCECRR